MVGSHVIRQRREKSRGTRDTIETVLLESAEAKRISKIDINISQHHLNTRDTKSSWFNQNKNCA